MVRAGAGEVPGSQEQEKKKKEVEKRKKEEVEARKKERGREEV